MTDKKYQFERDVTGFYRKSTGAPIPEFSFSRFKSLCYEVGRRNNARVSKFTQAGITPNFHSALFTQEQDSLVAVCNSMQKLVAFATPEDAASLHFIDHEGLAKNFKMSGYAVLGVELLNTALELTDTSLLDASELDQMAYWKSKTVGDVIFNWFD